MSRYFIAENQEGRIGGDLDEKNIPFSNYRLEDSGGAYKIGYLVLEEHWQTALEALNAKVLRLSETGVEDITEATLEFIQVKPEVIVKRFNGRNQDGFVQVAKKVLGPIVDKITIHVPHSDNFYLRELNPGFNIIFWQANGTERNVHPLPQSIWGIPVTMQDAAYSSSNQGITFMDENANYAVAEMIDNNRLYIHHDLCHVGNDYELAIFEELLNQVVFILTNGEICNSPIMQAQKEEMELVKALSGKVDVESWSGVTKFNYLQKIAEILLPAAGSIVVHCRGKKIAPPFADEKFHVIFWSAPSNMPFLRTPDTLWGYQNKMERISSTDAFQTSPVGIPICDDAGFEVAELVGRNLYIHYNLTSVRCEGPQKKIFSQLLLESVKLLQLDPDLLLQEKNRRHQQKLAISRQNYITFCGSNYARVIKKAEQDLQAKTKEVKDLQDKLIKVTRELEGLNNKISQISGNKTALNQKIGQEFDRLGSLPKIVHLAFVDNELTVYTDILYCQDPRTQLLHEIGAFLIHIPIDADRTSLRWFNLTRAVKTYKPDMQAPHVYEDGHACMGNFAELLPDLVANQELFSIAMLAIQFIESVNVNDGAGKYIHFWPPAPLEHQTEKGLRVLKFMENIHETNPFADSTSQHIFVRGAKARERGQKIRHCGSDCWCLGNDDEQSLIKSKELAEILKIPQEFVYIIMTSYFEVNG